MSKKSVMNRAKMIGISDTVSASLSEAPVSASPTMSKSSALGMSTTPSGPSSTPKTSPRTSEAKTPSRIAPRLPAAVTHTATRMPASAISAGPLERSPRPMPVASLLTVMPPSRSPTSVMNSPMPTPIDSFNGAGTARTTASRSPATTSTTAIRPSMTTHAIAAPIDSPRPRMRSNATTAFSPRPLASANGRLVTRPMTAVKNAAPSAVHTATAPNGSPAALRIAGLTKTM